MQNMGKAWRFWRELLLGTDADHLESCRAGPPWLPEEVVQAAMPRRLHCSIMPPAQFLYEGCSSNIAYL